MEVMIFIMMEEENGKARREAGAGTAGVETGEGRPRSRSPQRVRGEPAFRHPSASTSFRRNQGVGVPPLRQSQPEKARKVLEEVSKKAVRGEVSQQPLPNDSWEA